MDKLTQAYETLAILEATGADTIRQMRIIARIEAQMASTDI